MKSLKTTARTSQVSAAPRMTIERPWFAAADAFHFSVRGRLGLAEAAVVGVALRYRNDRSSVEPPAAMGRLPPHTNDR